VRPFLSLLSVFARGRTHIHFRDVAGAVRAAEEAGFPGVELHEVDAFRDRLGLAGAAQAAFVRVLAARTGDW
jgi:hypothetical protein